jgi:type II secretory pathway pseudopilin PulG
MASFTKIKSIGTPVELNRGFSLMDSLMAVALIGLSAVIAVEGFGPQAQAGSLAVQRAQMDVLNAAMVNYRALYRNGFRPETPWAAVNEAGVLAELARPLRRPGSAAAIVVMPEASRMNATGNGVVPTNSSRDAVWLVGDALANP